ncbi:sigma-70 family RNA polymerase sigma factor [Actinomadura meridiana]
MTADETRDDPPPRQVDPGRTQQSHGAVQRPDGIVGAARVQFLDFFTEQHPQVVRFVMFARHATFHAAEDAAQEAFIEAWRTTDRPGAWDQIRDPKAWIRTIALRRHDRPGGTRRREPPTISGVEELLTDHPAPQPDPSDLASGTARVLQALDAIDDDLTRAVMAFTLDGYPDSVIAAQTGTDTQRVRNHRAKARKLLRRYLGSSGTQEGGTGR